MSFLDQTLDLIRVLVLFFGILIFVLLCVAMM